MQVLLFLGLAAFLSSCSAMNSFFKTADDVMTMSALSIDVSKEIVPDGSIVEANVKITPPSSSLAPIKPKS